MAPNFLSRLQVPASDRPVIVRPAGRAIIVDPLGSVLLIEATDDRGPLWFTPGGAVEDGEDVEAATIREVAEETDIDLEALGPLALRRVARLEFLGDWIEAHETFYAVRLEDRPMTRGRELEAYEHDVILGRRWRSPADLRGDGLRIYPHCLSQLVEAITTDSLRAPWEELDVADDPAEVVIHHG